MMRGILVAVAWISVTATCLGVARGHQPTKYVNADLPSLLEFLDGSPVRNMEDWRRREEEIRRLMSETFIGTYPKETPAIIRAEILQQHKKPDGAIHRNVRLTFDTPNEVSFDMWVWIPPGEGPFPLMLTAPRYYQIGWAEMALKRGYLVCLYPGVDSHHREKNYPGYDSMWTKFRAEYPEATWTEISTKAWIASRALDYLLDPKHGCNVAKGQVGIIGFSRYGKQSLIAAALDERITSVVARSPGTPAPCPYRFATRHHFAESPAGFPDLWFLPRLRTFLGREDELPIDAHGWLALIAPRRCMIHAAYHDVCGPTFAAERTYVEGREVYRFFGRPENLCLCYRDGTHGPVTDEHRRQNLDWFDLSFGRGTARQSDFPERLLHQFDWEAWKAKQPEAELTCPFRAPAARDPGEIHARIRWALGTPPKTVPWDGKYRFLTDAESAMMTHDRWRVGGTARMPVSFGENVRGNIYYNPSIKAPATAIIWLHPYSYASGYNEGYGVEDTTVYHRLAKHGYVVLAYDQCGFGLRLLERCGFYEKYPQWSMLGHMVHDVERAVDFLVDGTGASKGEMPPVHKDRIYVLGYSLGGMVGLYAAAMDERIAGVACFCGFTPMRTDTDEKSTGGIRRLWQWHSLQPKLGLFHGCEADIPYDFHDVIALIAPRPCLIYSPQRDRTAAFEEVVHCVEEARKAWKTTRNAPEALTHLTPDDINRFQAHQQAIFLDWLNPPAVAR